MGIFRGRRESDYAGLAPHAPLMIPGGFGKNIPVFHDPGKDFFRSRPRLVGLGRVTFASWYVGRGELCDAAAKFFEGFPASVPGEEEGFDFFEAFAVGACLVGALAVVLGGAHAGGELGLLALEGFDVLRE